MVQHYPGRLYKLYLVGLPRTLHWMVDTVKPLLHPLTVANLKVCELEDLDAPLRRHLQPPVPESPGTPTGSSMAYGTVSPQNALHISIAWLRC